MISERSNHTLTSLADGRVLATGGEVYGFQEGSAECEIGDLRYITAVDNAAMPATFSMNAPFPNPFDASTTLHMRSEHHDGLHIAVWSTLGIQVRDLSVGLRGPGAQVVEWNGCGDDGRRVAPGAYFIRATNAAGEMQQHAVLLLR